MSKNILEKLSQAISEIDRPGTFCVSGSVQTVLPGLEVDGLGPIGLPLTGGQAKDLKKLCEQAPYGKGEKTLVDKSVRRVWRLKLNQFTLRNPDWKRFLQETLSRLQAELGLEKQKLESHLHELLLYEAGSFFLPHRDGEKLDRMVATLVIVLPASYEGGELVVRHDGQEQTIDFGSIENSALQTHFAAFYADCEHEVRPLRKGYRLCLIYNLTLSKSKKAITAPRNSEYLQRIIPLLREWSQDDTVHKLAITLDHQYTKDGLAWDKLKGTDRVKAHVLAEAARQVDCKAYLALLTFWESGSAEGDDDYGYGYERHRGWYDEDEDEDGDEDENDGGSLYEMGEVFEDSLSAEQWSDSAGQGLPIGKLTVEEDELLEPELLREVSPEEEFEGYTGNAGMTLERWYRHAAIFLWPARMHFGVLCDDDSRNVVPVLEQMVAKWQKSKSKDSEVQKSQCIGLAAAILAKWPENSYGRSHEREGESEDLLKTLAALADQELISRFLGEVMVKDAAVDTGKSLVKVCQAFGWDSFKPELEAIFKKTTIENMERNLRLFEEICLSTPRKKDAWAELCKNAARDLVSALVAIDGEGVSRDWRSRELNRAQVLSRLARALSDTGQDELFGSVVSHTLDLPEKYPLRTAHLPAVINLEPWLKKNGKINASGLSRWVAVCREQLEHLTAETPREPTDFRRSAAFSCKCADCAELRRFLQDPGEAVHRFSVRQDRRSHLEERIRHHKCDLNLNTERTRSPHTLVCTKNKASYQAELRIFHQDQQSLAAVIAIQKSLNRSSTSRTRQAAAKPKSKRRVDSVK